LWCSWEESIARAAERSLNDASVEEVGVGGGEGGDVVVLAEGGDLEEAAVIGSVLAISGVVVGLFGDFELR
jgi:hypothetical protein